MPVAKGQFATPEQALKRGCCPECGIELAGLSVEHHSRTHWPEIIAEGSLYDEARRRRDMLEAYAKDNS